MGADRGHRSGVELREELGTVGDLLLISSLHLLAIEVLQQQAG
jgi:hypothetical protein